MNNLSIVIRDKEDKIYEHLEKLKPLLEDNKTQLVLVNNEIEKFNIPYEYTHYEFQESYHKFSDFYESICLYDNKLLIEKGIQLNSEFIKSMKQSIENNKNFKVKIRKFINDNKTEYLVSDLILVTNDNSNEMELLDYFILEDYSMIAFNLEDIEVNLYNLLKSKSYEGIFKWYKACIRSKGKVYEQKFFEALECLKFILEVKEDEINKLFLSNEVNDRYKNYLTIMSLYQEKKDGFIKKIKSLLSIDSFQEEDIYFSNFIRKLFNDKKHCMEVLSCINTAYLNCCIRYILDKNETFYIDIYNFTVSIDLEKETSIKNNDRIPLILNILKSYISYMGDKSADIKKKNILIQMFLDYTNYGFYNLNKNIDINRDLSLNDETKFLIEMDKVADCLNKNLINEAISILRNAAEEYTPMTMAVRYYIQKLIRDNNIYKYKLSICMMAKNEEKFLNKCLNSIKPLLDCGMAELIFVDTGSTDSTAKIASNYVNKIYHKLWEGNFSKMRNYCISLAQGEYIFILDADEELEEGETEKLIKLFNSEEYTKYNTYTFKEKNFNDEEYKDFSMLIRNAIFKNREDFCYYGSVHNQPNKIGPINDLDIILLHYGYIMTEDIKDKKFIRTATLLKKELQKEPRDVYYRYQLSVSYSMHGDHKKALEQVNVYMKLLEDKKLTKGLSLMAYNNAAIIYHLNGLYEKVIEVCNRALEIEPTFIDFVYNKALAQFASEQYSEAINNYLQYLDLITNIEKITILNDDRYIFYSLGSKNEALGKLLICYYKINDCDSFNKTIDKIDDDTLLKYCVYTILKFYIENKRYSDLKQFFIEKIMLNHSPDVKYVFSYFISEVIDECNEEEKQNIVKLFDNINESNEYLETIKSLISSEGDSLAILDFINKCNLDKLDLVTAKMVLDKTYELVAKNDVINNFTLEETKALKDAALFILNNTINSKLFRGLSKENLLIIINNYIELCNKLISEERFDLLTKKEIKFSQVIKLAREDFNNNNLTLGLRKVRDAVVIHEEMARPMQLYLETIIQGYDAGLEYFNNENGEQKMNNEFVEYSKKIKLQIEDLINNNSLDEAKLLIKQYNEIVNNDVEVYSMEAIIYIMKGNLEKAEEILLDGLNIGGKNFELNYNLAYVYEQEEDYGLAYKYYNNALEICNDQSVKEEINTVLENIKIKELNVVNEKKKIVFFDKGDDKFISDIVNELSKEYETKKVTVRDLKQIDEWMQWADICWFEWCDELISYGSKHKLATQKKIICRLHSYEAFTNYPSNVIWDNVDRIIFVAEHIREFVIDKFKINKDKTEVIPNGIDLSKYKFNDRKHGYNIAYVGYINYKKGPMLLLHTFKAIYDKDNRYKLYIAGQFQDERDVLYFEQMIKEFGIEKNVFFQGWQDNLDIWLEDKNYILCTSVLESQNMSVMQAMTKGIKPLIHNFVGAKSIYNEDYIWNTINEAVNILEDKNYNSKEYFEFIKDNYSTEREMNSLKKLLKFINNRVKKENFNYAEYWNNRLNNKFDIEGVGYIGLGQIYNKFLYKTRLEILNFIIEKLFDNINNRNVLELGPGIGVFTDYFYKNNPNKYYAIDISEKSQKELSKKYKKFEFILGDISEKKYYPNDKYDLIFAADVLLHLTDEEKYKAVINNLSSALKDEGFIVTFDPITVINSKSISPHLVIRDIKYIENILKENELEVIGVMPSAFFMNYPFDKDIVKDKADIAQNTFNLIQSIFGSVEMSDNTKQDLAEWLSLLDKQCLINNQFGLSQKVIIIKKKCNNVSLNFNINDVWKYNEIKLRSIDKEEILNKNNEINKCNLVDLFKNNINSIINYKDNLKEKL